MTSTSERDTCLGFHGRSERGALVFGDVAAMSHFTFGDVFGDQALDRSGIAELHRSLVAQGAEIGIRAPP